MTTTHSLRDGYLQTRTFSEEITDPRLRSGDLLTDALFAMAVFEAKENSVSEISDGAFSETVACDCYQTGEPLELGLDARHWLCGRSGFKAFGYRNAGGIRCGARLRNENLVVVVKSCKIPVQLALVCVFGSCGLDTGAMAIWRQTRDPQMQSQLIDVLRNTVETDRAYVLDPVDGLYRGETSFLDWRAQTYPQWMVDTPAHIAMSKSLSTNLSHLYTLRALEELTNEDWGSAALAITIDEAFWNGTSYSSFVATDLFPIQSTSKIYWQPASLSWTWEPIRKPYSNIRTLSSEHLSSTRSNNSHLFTTTEPTGPSYLRMPFLPPNSLTMERSSTRNSMPSSKVLRSISRIWKTGKSKRVRTGTKMVNTPVPSSIHGGNSGLLPDLLAL